MAYLRGEGRGGLIRRVGVRSLCPRSPDPPYSKRRDQPLETQRAGWKVTWLSVPLALCLLDVRGGAAILSLSFLGWSAGL